MTFFYFSDVFNVFLLQAASKAVADVEQCKDASTLSCSQCEDPCTLSAAWFSAVSANDVNVVDSMIQQRSVDVNVSQVCTAVHQLAVNALLNILSQ